MAEYPTAVPSSKILFGFVIVSITLTRRYDGGALPAGRYDAVRLDIGTRRAGRNWWCVLYPGLCRSACGGYDTPAENDLVCGEYIVRFRFVEWWDGLTAPREDVVLAG